jgi:hypothetical protein
MQAVFTLFKKCCWLLTPRHVAHGGDTQERRRAAKERKKQREADAVAAAQANVEREARDALALAAAAAGALALPPRDMCEYTRRAACGCPIGLSFPVAAADGVRVGAPGSRSKATSLLESARAAERSAREERAAAAERRFGAMALGGGGARGGSGGATGSRDGAGPSVRQQQPPAAVPWGSGSIAGGPAAATAAGVSQAPAFGGDHAPAPAFGSAAPAFGAAAGAPPHAAVDLSETATSALLARVTPEQAALLCRILSNAAEHPGDAKFRRLRLSNAKVADALLASGAMDGLLRAHFDWTLEAEGDALDVFAVQAEAAVRTHAPAMLRTAARLKTAAGS